MKEPVDVSVVVPCYNEQDALPALFGRLRGLMEERGRRWEAIFVDDGSTDSTAAVLEAEVSRTQWMRIVRHQVNRGVGAALRTGFAAAGAPVICTIDSDCTYPPERLPELVERLGAGADLVTASPWHPANRHVDGGLLRTTLSRGASLAYRLLTGVKVHTASSIFRAYRREAIERIEFDSSGFPAVTEILIRGALAGFRIVEIPMPLARRRHGRSKMSLGQALAGHLKLLRLAAGWARAARRERERRQRPS